MLRIFLFAIIGTLVTTVSAASFGSACSASRRADTSECYQDRPSVVYALQGIDPITLGDGSKKILKPRDTTSATKDTTHWHKNEGNEEVLLLAVDIFNAAKAKK